MMEVWSWSFIYFRWSYIHVLFYPYIFVFALKYMLLVFCMVLLLYYGFVQGPNLVERRSFWSRAKYRVGARLWRHGHYKSWEPDAFCRWVPADLLSQGKCLVRSATDANITRRKHPALVPANGGRLGALVFVAHVATKRASTEVFLFSGSWRGGSAIHLSSSSVLTRVMHVDMVVELLGLYVKASMFPCWVHLRSIFILARVNTKSGYTLWGY